MTLFAGLFSVRPDRTIPKAYRDDFARQLSRHPGDLATVSDSPSLFAKWIDIGALGGGIARDTGGTLTVVAGDPVIRHLGSNRCADDLDYLHRSLSAGQAEGLIGATGSFCAFHFHPNEHRLWLIADKLGVRPIYYGIHDGIVVFSTVLRVFEKLPWFPCAIDIRGAGELACFGYPLADRTAYQNISTISAGTIVEATTELSSRTYWAWDSLPAVEDHGDLPTQLHQRFSTAVRKRLQGDTAAVSFLSGGLDSRCIVGALRELGVHVHSMNFAPSGTQDFVCGRLIADALGTQHFEYPMGPDDFANKQRSAHQAWLTTLSADDRPPRPALLWSGDGGSCGLGHVYLSEKIIELARSQGFASAADEFLRHNSLALPRKLFREPYSDEMPTLPKRGILEELAKIRCADPGRAMHLFIMLNDQRRHLAAFFEDIDINRIELSLPFFDAEFLELIIAAPIDQFLKHRFYNTWLKTFAPPVFETPWQAYPGHAPCPVPLPEGLRNQWIDCYAKDDLRMIKRTNGRAAFELLSKTHFPSHLLRRTWLGVAGCLTYCGISDLSYVIRTAGVFTRSNSFDDRSL
jgi:asparagine synthase (glutamine-hydrolysing)